MTRMKTHTPISAMAVSSTLLLGVRYSFALQLKSGAKVGCVKPGSPGGRHSLVFHDEAVLIKLKHASLSQLPLFRAAGGAGAHTTCARVVCGGGWSVPVSAGYPSGAAPGARMT